MDSDSSSSYESSSPDGDTKDNCKCPVCDFPEMELISGLLVTLAIAGFIFTVRV